MAGIFATDLYVVFVLEVAVVFFAIYAIHRDGIAAELERTSEVQAEVTRSDKSMTAIHTVYAAAVASALVLLNNADALAGNRVVLIIVNFSSFTYLFYFSSWFRNSVFFPILGKVRKD